MGLRSVTVPPDPVWRAGRGARRCRQQALRVRVHRCRPCRGVPAAAHRCDRSRIRCRYCPGMARELERVAGDRGRSTPPPTSYFRDPGILGSRKSVVHVADRTARAECRPRSIRRRTERRRRAGRAVYAVLLGDQRRSGSARPAESKVRSSDSSSVLTSSGPPMSPSNPSEIFPSERSTRCTQSAGRFWASEVLAHRHAGAGASAS